MGTLYVAAIFDMLRVVYNAGSDVRMTVDNAPLA